MAFVQIMQFRTTDLDAVRKIEEEWRAATEGKRTIRREITARDRNDPDRYVGLVFFDSYESAMENSNLPETDAAARQLQAITEGLTFQDLDVIDEWS
jgi:hypothetical protein